VGSDTHERWRTAEYDVAVWRRRLLRESGVPDDLVRMLADDRRYDLHAFIELTERGCAPRLAARILAPLDDEPAPR
jgi:hypothetical protein